MNNIMKEKLVVFLIVEEIILQSMFFMQMFVNYTGRNQRRQHINNRRRYSMISRIPDQVNNMYRLIEFTDDACVDSLRMNRNAFGRLCYLLHHVGGLVESRSVNVPEKVAMFLQVIAHHTKNRIVKHNFTRSGHTVSKYFNDVLKAVLKLHPILLIEPEAISTDCKNPRWKCFQGCLGALDGTYIKVKVAETDKPRYRNRKGDISVNVLGVCNRKMNFIYVLPGWEGSAADGRVLRDAISRPHGLKVPKGHYYLCDNGYANSEGFLTPYKSARYHLDEWGDGSRAPRNYEEYFNMKHTKARNIIERAFGLLKERWGILRTYSSYPIKTHNHIIMACCLLHNFIRAEMDIDPLENFQCELDDDRYLDREFFSTIDPSPQWNSWRDTLALNMFTEWRRAR